MEKKEKILAAVSAVLGLVLILCVKIFTPVCSGMLELTTGKQVAMKCHYTSVVLVFLGILFIVNGVAGFVSRQSLSCGIMTIALAVLVFVVLNDKMGIGICLKPEMACHTTAPVAKVCATVQLVIGVFMAVSSAKKEK